MTSWKTNCKRFLKLGKNVEKHHAQLATSCHRWCTGASVPSFGPGGMLMSFGNISHGWFVFAQRVTLHNLHRNMVGSTMSRSL